MRAGVSVDRRPWPVRTMAQGLVVVIVIAFALVAYRGDLTRFFHIGDTKLAPVSLPSAFVYHGTDGYDGAQYLALALDPLVTRPATSASVDNTRYRTRRILYPALGFVLGAWNERMIPGILVALNLAAFVALIGIVDRLVGGPDSLLTLCLAGCWISALYGTPELIEGSLVVGALLAYQRRRPVAVGALLALAMLCRETSALVFLGFVVAGIAQRDRRLLRHLAWAWIPAVAWNTFVLARFTSGHALGDANFSWPFLGFVQAFHELPALNAGIANEAFWIGAIVSLLVVAAAFVWRFREILAAQPPVAFAGLAYVLLLIVAGKAILGYHLGFHRAFLPLYLMALVGLTSSGHRSQARWILLAHGLLAGAWLLHSGIKEFTWT